MSRVVLAMSGGVDSSVAAHLLTAAGHEVVGVFMRHGHTSPVACETESSIPFSVGGYAESTAAWRRLTPSPGGPAARAS